MRTAAPEREAVASEVTTFEPFVIQTCESRHDAKSRKISLAPAEGKPFSPFEIQDPLGIRNAIVPVFRQTLDGDMYGMGTAFHVDGYGNFLTAHHVVDFVGEKPESRPVLFLSMHAVVFGQVNIPSDCFVPAAEILAVMADSDNPLDILRGRHTRRPTLDVAVITPEILGPDVRRPSRSHFESGDGRPRSVNTSWL